MADRYIFKMTSEAAVLAVSAIESRVLHFESVLKELEAYEKQSSIRGLAVFVMDEHSTSEDVAQTCMEVQNTKTCNKILALLKEAAMALSQPKPEPDQDDSQHGSTSLDR